MKQKGVGGTCCIVYLPHVLTEKSSVCQLIPTILMPTVHWRCEGSIDSEWIYRIAS